MFGFLRKLVFRAPPRSKTISDTLWRDALLEVPLFDDLSSEEENRLRSSVEQFLHEKWIEGAKGLEVTDRMKVLIAAQACLPVLEIGLGYYRHLRTLIVYPDAYRSKMSTQLEDGSLTENEEARVGEAWEGGPVVLSWKDTLEGGREEDGYNVVIHEFTHQLDGISENGEGIPVLPDPVDSRTWVADLKAGVKLHRERISRGEECLLDEYAGEHPIEFFAVLTEAFFELPLETRDEFPALYQHLATFFRQDPARRLEAYLSQESSGISAPRFP